MLPSLPRTNHQSIILSGLLAALAVTTSVSQAALPTLQVSENQRFLITSEGDPFFWLGDTAWELFHRLDREEIDVYLTDRAEKGFNVVQCVVLAECDGLTVPNREGQVPFHDLDPSQPNEAYFDLVDYVARRAGELGLYLALLPTWGAHVEDAPHVLFDNVHPFTPETVRAYGAFLGERYGPRNNIVWILGGDRLPTGHEAIWEAMGAGIREADPDSLMSYHVHGGKSSSEFWHDAEWLDFNMLQSGHYTYNQQNWKMIAKDYARVPPKPTFDAEPNYEDHPVAFTAANPRFTDYDVRKAAYWSVFSGAFGHTYGHVSLWQISRPDENEPILNVNIDWREALEAPGAGQMHHLKNLMLSRPYLKRIPAQDLLKDTGIDSDHLQATRDGTPGESDATYIMVYHPIVRSLTIETSVIPGERLRGWWYDPRTGEAILAGEIENPLGEFSRPWDWAQKLPLNSPGDWVLVLDDVAANYPAPGQIVQE